MALKLVFALCIVALLLCGAFAELNSTDTILPTKLKNTTVEVEANSKKLNVMVRSYDASVAVPTLNCTFKGASSPDFRFSWSWKNDSQLSYTNDGLQTKRHPPSGTLDQNKVYGMLVFNNFATKAVNYVGEYKCSVGSTSAYPSLLSAPVVKMSDKDYRSVMEGDLLTQTCSVTAFPAPRITWMKNGEPLALEQERVVLSADNRTLTINSLQKEDAGVYICSARNDYGTGEAYIRLRVKDRLAALWPFLGIVAEVIILVTIILLYEKKRAAQKRNQEHQDAAEVKEEPNANDGDVRHRPVKS